MKNNAIGALLTAAFAIPMFAVPGSAIGEWSGDIEGGTVIQGDGEGSRIRFKMSNSERPLNQQFYADWIRVNSSDSYKIGYEPRYWFTDRTYVFGDGNYVFGDASASVFNDANTGTNVVDVDVDPDNTIALQAAPIDQQINLFAGLGIQLLSSQTTSLFAEIGAGQSSTKFEPTTGFADQDTTSTTARIGATQLLTDFFKLEFDGDYTTSEKIDTTTGEAGLSFGAPGGGAIKYTYRVRSREIDGLPAVETTDSFVSFNYGF